MSRLLTALVTGGLCVLLAAPAAVGKGDVQARLDTPLPLEASAGRTITIGWTLSYADRANHGSVARSRHPFGAGGVFIQVLSASGRAPVKALGEERGRGRYVAQVTVPEGGIGGIKIGLEGIRYIGGRAENAPAFFPVVNYPLARPPATSTGSADGDDSSAIWLAAVGAVAALGVILTLSRALISRRRSRLA
jgi:hypothetical protein